eukprot:3345535-Pyramimonas_sp.AAC.1
MPINKYCPKPTAAAVWQAAFLPCPRRHRQRVAFKMGRTCRRSSYPFLPHPFRSLQPSAA